MPETAHTRRNFLRQTSIAGAALTAPFLAVAQQKPESDKAKGEEEKKKTKEFLLPKT